MSSEPSLKKKGAPQRWQIFDTTRKRLSGLTKVVGNLLASLRPLQASLEKENKKAQRLVPRFEASVAKIRDRTSDTAPFIRLIKDTARDWRAEEAEEGSKISKEIARHQRVMTEGKNATKATELENGKLHEHIQAIKDKTGSCHQQKEQQVACLGRCAEFLKESDAAVGQMQKILRDMNE